MCWMQVRTPQTAYRGREIAVYALRWLVAALVLEAWLHFFPVYAFSAAGLHRRGTWPAQFVLSYAWCFINALWLKFLVLWRFFRLWALADGIECVENMNRCVNNNYTLTGAWLAGCLAVSFLVPSPVDGPGVLCAGARLLAVVASVVQSMVGAIHLRPAWWSPVSVGGSGAGCAVGSHLGRLVAA